MWENLTKFYSNRCIFTALLCCAGQGFRFCKYIFTSWRKHFVHSCSHIQRKLTFVWGIPLIKLPGDSQNLQKATALPWKWRKCFWYRYGRACVGCGCSGYWVTTRGNHRFASDPCGKATRKRRTGAVRPEMQWLAPSPTLVPKSPVFVEY